MSKIAYRDPKNLQMATRKLLGKITEVLEDFQEQGYTLTLRQLYYQLVSKDIIPNNIRSYAKLSKILTDARMCGMVDWDAIEDRIRVPKKHAEWSNVQELVESATAQYRKDRHDGQENYVEVWVEKDALSGVLSPITDKYHLSLMVNRGYSSVSAMHDAAIRFLSKMDEGKSCTILYLGDHDPSGLDMIRDISDRLREFGADVNVKAIALTMDQINEYNPPPNPAKITDPRAKDYISAHGEVSWELDALQPKMLNQLLKDNIEALVDMNKYNEIIQQEHWEKEELEKFADTMGDEED